MEASTSTKDSCDLLRNFTQAKQQSKRKNSSSQRYVVTPEQQQRADAERALRHVENADDENGGDKVEGGGGGDEESENKKKKKVEGDDNDDDEVIIVDNDNDAMLFPFTGLDLLRELWTPHFTAQRNIRLMIAAVRSRQMKLEAMKYCWNDDRKKEVSLILKMLSHLHEWWGNKVGVICTAHDVMKTIYENTSEKRFISTYDYGFLSEEAMQDWKRFYKEYVAELVGKMMEKGLDDKSPKDSGSSGDGEKEGQSGLDGLFVECSGDNTRDVVRQFVAKLEDGRLQMVKSPGETGTEVVRMQVYDTKDIATREPRTWWRYAKLRTQFISDGFRKGMILRRLLDQVADDLKTVPGIVRENQQVIQDCKYTCKYV